MKEITIKSANEKIKHLENIKRVKETERDITFDKTQPKAVDTTRTIVQGGTREDRYVQYVIELEQPKYLKLTQEIEWIKKEINSLSDYVENELKIIGEYEPLKAKIITLRQQNKTWEQLYELIQGQYSISQCRRIYKKYIERRYIEDEHQMNR